MKITFYGAARHVTGSCTLVETNGTKLLIDCGLPQGKDEKECGTDLPCKASEIDYVLLTHAHIDHSGRIPLLVKEGFDGRILCTEATVDLCGIMLPDSAHIQESETEWINRKAKRAGKELVEPLYTTKDALKALELFEGCTYGEVIPLTENIKVRFSDAGHLLGSSSIKLFLDENDHKKEIVFSGDIGNLDQPIIEDPKYLKQADYVIMESTYGDRNHTNQKNITTEDRAEALEKIITDTFKRGGNVIIPAFSVGRTQEILYILRHLWESKKFSVPVFLDSPLSVKATKVFSTNMVGYFDKEAMEIVKKGENPLLFPTLVTITEVEDSKALNFRREPCVIISSSGMCEAGRIKHHLKHNLWREESSIVFTGYQAEGTLGRTILDGKKEVKIYGEEIYINAQIHNLEGLSGHADKNGLIKWIDCFNKKPEKVFVVHGDKDIAPYFAEELQKRGYDAIAPEVGEYFKL